MNTWYLVEINGSTGYMLVRDGVFVGYFDSANNPITPDAGSTVFTIENDVAGPV